MSEVKHTCCCTGAMKQLRSSKNSLITVALCSTFRSVGWPILASLAPTPLSGDTAKAKTAYQDFLALWKDANSDIPILKEAKAEYAEAAVSPRKARAFDCWRNSAP